MADEIRARIVFDTGGLGGAFGGSLGGKEKSFSGALGGMGAGSAKGIASGVAMGMIGATAILGALKGLFTKLVDSFPGLQASLQTMEKSLGLFLRPIAMILDMFLRPMAILMMRFAIQWLKWFQESQITEKMKQAGAEFAAAPAEKITSWFDNILVALDDFDMGVFVDGLLWEVNKWIEELDKVPWVEKIVLLLILVGEKLFEGLVAAIPYVAKWLVDLGEQAVYTSIWQCPHALLS